MYVHRLILRNKKYCCIFNYTIIIIIIEQGEWVV